MPGATIVDKILLHHVIAEEGGRSLVYVDRVVIADTASGAFNAIAAAGHSFARPAQALVVPDHYTPSHGKTLAEVSGEDRRRQIGSVQAIAERLQVPVFPMGDARRGIQHVVSTEQGFAQPGIVLVAVDSHTSTQGAVGALALSVGSDLPHVLATQCIWLKMPRTMRITLTGRTMPGVTVKDVGLALIARLGANGGAGFATEYAGDYIRNLSMEGRMTLCNLTAEIGSIMGIISPDQKTFDYVRGRPFAPTEAHWDDAVALWQSWTTDLDAAFDREEVLDVSTVAPTVTWGNSVATALPIDGDVPDPGNEADPVLRAQMQASIDYMGLEPGTPLNRIAIDQVFIGSCSNSRIEDLRAAADVLRGRTVKVPALVVPGSGLVKAQAEAEGLDRIFLAAGCDWGEAGCSMCVSMNGDAVPPGARCASTSNRNHMGRQGRGSRTHLMSPAMAAAAAVTGRLTDIRTFGDAA